MPYKMPVCLQILQLRRFGFPLLYSVLAKVAKAGVECFTHTVSAKCFGDSDHCDVPSIAPRTLRCSGDTITDFIELLGHGRRAAAHGGDSSRLIAGRLLLGCSPGRI